MSADLPFFFDDLERYAHEPLCVSESGAVWTYAEVRDRGCASLQSVTGRPLVFLCASNTVDMIGCYMVCLERHWPVVLTAHMDQALFDRQVTQFNPNVIVYPDGDGVHVDVRHTKKIPLFDDLCVLLSTSGSTGSPKMVKLNADNIDSNARSIAEYLELGKDDRGVTSLKFNYSYGMSVINATLAVGGSILLTDRPVTDSLFWSAFAAQGCTHFAGVPYSFEMLARMEQRLADCHSLRFMTQAGGRLSPELVRKFAEMGERQGWQLYVMYGQTEAAPRIAYLLPALAREHPSAIGQAIPGGRIDILGADGSLIDKPGIPGELRYSGPNVFAGYAEDSAGLANAEINTCLMTGDIAQWNEAGLVEIVGRASRFVKPFGLRINLDDVATEAGKIAGPAIATGNDDQIVVAVLQENWREENEAAIISRLSTAYKLPSSLFVVVVVGEFPRLANGKIDYKAIPISLPSNGELEPALTKRRRNSRLEWIVSRNQVLTLLVSGLWHGAAWTFIGWGLIHGLLLVLQRQIGGRIRALYPAHGWPARISIVAQVVIVFIVVAATRVIFRSPDLHHAGRMMAKIFGGPYNWGALDGKAALAMSGVIIISVTVAEIFAEKGFWRRLFRRRRSLRCAAVALVFLLTVMIGEFEGGRFVYVRF